MYKQKYIKYKKKYIELKKLKGGSISQVLELDRQINNEENTTKGKQLILERDKKKKEVSDNLELIRSRDSTKRYIIVTVGPTGSGKTDLINKVEKKLGITPVEKKNYILIDNLVENDTWYKDEVKKIITTACLDKTIDNCDMDVFNNPNKTLLEKFGNAYQTSRADRIEGCTVSKEKISCNNINNNNFTNALLRGDNIIFETTGEYNLIWFLSYSSRWSQQYRNLVIKNYDIVYAYSLVNFNTLLTRNIDRTVSGINFYMKNTSTSAPRLPDLSIEVFKPKVVRIIKNLINFSKICLLGNKDESTCGMKKPDKLLIYNNNLGKGNMNLIIELPDPDKNIESVKQNILTLSGLSQSDLE